MTNDPYSRRAYIISGAVVLVVMVFIIRLFWLQIIDQSQKQKADSNALLRQVIYPSRGLIYDRNGELLVFNQPIYEVTLIMQEMRHGFDTVAFCQCLGIDSLEFEQRIAAIKDKRKNRGFSTYTPQIFMAQLTKQDVASLRETSYKFSGAGIRKRTLRGYSYPYAAHILGSVGEVSQADIDRDDYYQAGDYSGRDGLERTYEQRLRGTKGVEIIMRDSRGRIQGSYHDGAEDVEAVTGTDLHLSLDIQLQALAEQMLQGKVGSVVAIEPATGEILALASSPTWNPEILVGKQRSAQYNRLLNDPSKPLINRATQAMYPPGSTFKTIQSVVCLQEGGITPNTKYPCSGPSTTPIKCTHHHGSPVSLLGAIEQSCNPYFYCAFRDMLQRDGFGNNNITFRKRYNLWRNDVLKFGLGQRFEGTDIGEQAGGAIPTERLFNRTYGEKGWKAVTIRSLSIGQGEVLATPLQLANQAATLANRGYYITPHLNTELTNDPSLRHETGMDSTWFSLTAQGMHLVMTNGTGRWYNIDSLQMCGKTGTAQNPHGKDHAIFIGFAPMDKPKIAVAVVVENAGFGATWAAPVASLMMEQYLTGTIRRKHIYNKMVNAVLEHPSEQQ
ncbi:MAG: penicillin-binding protein 2 [Paludibacteraceae bacterium]|nr:penicillin-binding protein 2 [Paludibacteraceae bacterium]